MMKTLITKALFPAYSVPKYFSLNVTKSAFLEIDFRSPTTASDLNTFIDNHLQPTTEFNNEMNETVNKICKLLCENIQRAEVVKVISIQDLILLLQGVPKKPEPT